MCLTGLLKESRGWTGRWLLCWQPTLKAKNFDAIMERKGVFHQSTPELDWLNRWCKFTYVWNRLHFPRGSRNWASVVYIIIYVLFCKFCKPFFLQQETLFIPSLKILCLVIPCYVAENTHISSHWKVPRFQASSPLEISVHW